MIVAHDATPQYVLMDEFRRIGPCVLGEIEYSPIYGFSDKEPYDIFCTNSELVLTPYPLVKTYLRFQANTSDNELKMVVINATGPRDPCLHAATISAVLESQEKQMAQVALAYRLVFDRQAEAYSVEMM